MVRPHLIRSVSTALAAVLVFIALPVEAQWKWKDKGGHVQYSDLPPPAGTPDQDILSRPSAQRRNTPASPMPAASAASSAQVVDSASGPLAPKLVDAELEARRKKAEADQGVKNKAEEDRIAAVKADNCARARGLLRTLDSGIRVTRSNDKGEREFLDDKQRADETRHAKDAIAADCK